MSGEKREPKILINQPLEHPVPDRIDRKAPPITGYELHDHGKADDGAVEGQTTKHTLVDMAKDGFEFFTTALIFTAGRFDRDPLVEFERLYPAAVSELEPVAIDYDYPFFEGIGSTVVNGELIDWDRRIYAIRKERWTHCRDCVAGIHITDPKTRFYAKVGFYEFNMVDPFAVKKQAVISELPTVPLTVFGVSSNNYFVHLQPRQWPKLPIVATEPARLDMKIEANSVLGPPLQPEKLNKREK